MLIDMKEIERIGGVKDGHNPDIAHALRTLELNDLLIREVNDGLVTLALQGFDTGTGDPNDYRKRMRAALESALSTQPVT